MCVLVMNRVKKSRIYTLFGIKMKVIFLAPQPYTLIADTVSKYAAVAECKYPCLMTLCSQILSYGIFHLILRPLSDQTL